MPRTYIVAIVAVLAACGPQAGGSDGDATTTGDPGTSSSAASSSSTEASTSTASTSTTTTTGIDTGQASSSSEGMKLDLPGCPPLACFGQVYRCTDLEDNDGDGLVDLADPECTSPCDDDEGSFQGEGSLPGDASLFDCKPDCLFDGNSGQGDDGCLHDLSCDPEEPAGPWRCDYSPPACPNNFPEQSPECIAWCEPFVPPGCDCFSCCTFMTVDGPVDVFLEASPDCRLDNLAACPPCTSQIETCGNPCTPETCEICIGESGPPEGCETNACDNGEPCSSQADCACDEMCLLGCCLPQPPG